MKRFSVAILHFLQLGWHSTNVSQKEIALQVGTSESTISNEKKRNKNTDGSYDADAANNLAAKRRKGKKSYKFNEKIKKSIENLLGGTPLEKQYSPEQIVGTLKKRKYRNNESRMDLSRSADAVYLSRQEK